MKQVAPWFSAVSLSLMMFSLPAQAAGEEKTDAELITRLREEALQHSQVQDHFSVLTDEIGARLTGSPGLKRAADWAQTRLRSWGLEKSIPKALRRSVSAGNLNMRACAC
jgi:hypothetical protein